MNGNKVDFKKCSRYRDSYVVLFTRSEYSYFIGNSANLTDYSLFFEIISEMLNLNHRMPIEYFMPLETSFGSCGWKFQTTGLKDLLNFDVVAVGIR